MSHALINDPAATWVQLFGTPVSAWMLMVHAGFVVGAMITLWRARTRGLSMWRSALVIAMIYIGALAGARVFAVFFSGHWDHFREHPSHAFELWRGGFVFYGGLLGAASLAVASATLLRLPIARLADVCAPGAAFGIAMGRIGCFVSGCCYGTPTGFVLGYEYWNFAQPARPIGVPLHPAQLYEAIGLLIIAAVLWRHSTERRASGRTFLVFLLAYAVLRFLVEFLRGDPRGELLGLPTSQFISLLLAPAVAWLLIRNRGGIPGRRVAR